ncbi:hypothetical protein ACFVT5_14385 [Streptomyces sp. NPDC058001]|uniref:hypothetical protein n=1 Tax=Streptomyces sp. NPDC058001 TaxID=3346300 RepID=UPI0036EAA5DA
MDPDTGHTRQFGPLSDQVALLERLVDRNGNTIDFDYDTHGVPLGIRHCGGYHLAIATEDGRVTALNLVGSAADGADTAIKRFGYTDGQLTDITDSSGLPLRLTYDDRLRVTSWTDTNDSSYVYGYDEQDRCTSQAGGEGHMAYTFAYDGTDPAFTGHRVTTLTSAAGAVSRYVISAGSQVVAEIDPLGHITRTAYDSNHHILSRTNALGHTTRFVNDESGRPLAVIRPDGAQTAYEYNELGLPLTLTLPDRATVHCAYDTRGNRIAVTDTDGETTRYTYTTAGHLAGYTDPLGATTTIRTDVAGLPLEITDPLGAVIRHERDALGRTTTMTDPAGAVTHLQWTVEGQLASQHGHLHLRRRG